MWRLLAALCVTLSLGGCVTPTLLNVRYERPVTQTSQLNGSIQLVTGIVEGARGTSYVPIGGGALVPISTGPEPSLYFGPVDQQIFMVSLRDELTRLGILRSATLDEKPATGDDLTIQMIFVHTSHNPRVHEYYLSVVMQIISRELTFAKRYEILSSEGDSLFEKLGTNAQMGKQKAGTKLMDALVPDIERFLAELEKLRTQSSSLPGPLRGATAA